jgi:hypothetical protein
MRRSLLMLFVWGISILMAVGCSREEQPPPPKKPKVVKKSIAKPSSEAVKPVPAQTEEKAKSEESPRPEVSAKTTGIAKPEVAARVEKVPGPGAETGSKEKPGEGKSKPEAVVKAEEKPKAQEKPKPEPAAKPERMDKPEAQVKAEAKQARVEPTPKAPARESAEKAAKKEGAKEYYTVKKGDTLAKVAGREDVYGNPLKWPVIYRMNLDALGSLPVTEKLPDTELPGGKKLRIIRPEEMKKNLEKRAGHFWVVNVISATTLAEIMPAVIGAIKNDFTAYISTARVNDKDWMRVRVGFFMDRTQAEAEGKKIMEILNFKDSWTTKLGKNEFAEFAGY